MSSASNGPLLAHFFLSVNKPYHRQLPRRRHLLVCSSMPVLWLRFCIVGSGLFPNFPEASVQAPPFCWICGYSFRKSSRASPAPKLQRIMWVIRDHRILTAQLLRFPPDLCPDHPALSHPIHGSSTGQIHGTKVSSSPALRDNNLSPGFPIMSSVRAWAGCILSHWICNINQMH